MEITKAFDKRCTFLFLGIVTMSHQRLFGMFLETDGQKHIPLLKFDEELIEGLAQEIKK